MSLIKEAQLKKFIESGKIEQVGEAVASANETASAFTIVSVKLTQLAMSLVGDIRMLEQLDEEGEVGAMEELTETINAKLEVFKDLKLLKAIDDLSEMLKVKKAKKTSAKEEAQKALGL